ncbi:MAG: DUF305 domain-containing protein [Polaromonas sp.]|uniref:DUF305 domain-containing protein n=1 Tax=Polaromonas sp. TaxID=1869339 RepID=UPI00248918E1|nr:DUF305 domain-containing protein [Polaromonas sp.]MDI1268059.1 DUF305 domain-containing protein [Polaromonas sp.]
MISKFTLLNNCGLGAAILAATLVSPVVHAQSSGAAGGAMSGMQGTPAASAPMQGSMDMKAMMKDNNDKMAAMKMTGNADADFAMMMRMHHQGAIDMAEAHLRSGKDPEMLRMAKKIISDQKK